MVPSPARVTPRHHSARGSAGPSALTQITNAVLDTLHIHTNNASTSPSAHPHSLRPIKGAKVHVDSRSATSKRSMRRSADIDALGGGTDSLRARKISIRERSSGRAAADAAAVDLAHAAMLDADVQGLPPGLSRRPSTLGSARAESFSGSILKAKILGDAPQHVPPKKHATRKHEGDPDIPFDYVVDGYPGGPNDADDGLYMDDGDNFDDDDFDDDDDDNDPYMRRLRAVADAEQDELAYFSHRGASFHFKVGRRWVLHPYGRLRSCWDCFLLGLITWILITTPFELSFRELAHTTRRAILSIDYFLDAMFAVDILLNFLTAVESDGRLHFSFASIRRQYLYGWFLMDTLWTFPFYALTHTTGADVPDYMSIDDLFRSDLYPLLRLFRLARIVSLARIRRRLEFSLRISSSSSSLGGFVFSVLAISHLFSCMFAYLAFGDEYHLNMALRDHTLEDDSIYSKYIASSYWAMMTIATVGYGDLTVKTSSGRLFSIVAMVMGGGIFAYGISNVVDLFQQLYVEETEHRHKMDQVNIFMHDRALPGKLRDEIRASFFHLRKATRENKTEDLAIVQRMSRTMQSHVADLFCLDMMPMKMPTLAGCNAEFIHELYLAMEVQCYLPGEDILRQDEFGSEMYFLFVGYVQVFVGHTKVALFGPNTCFGEFAILHPRRPRLATIKAMDFCETHCVSRTQLLMIVLKHPFVLQSIRQLVQLTHRKALAVLTDQTTKTRTLIQSLAVVWHTDGLQALMPPGRTIDDYPELQPFAAAAERPVAPLPRLSSVRMGLTNSTATVRRKSVSTDPAMDVTSNTSSTRDVLAKATGTGDSQPRRRSSIANTESSSGAVEPTETSANGSATARAKRNSVRTMDGDGSARHTSGDDRMGLVLHQMNLLLKRQEKLEHHMQHLLEHQRHRVSVHTHFPSPSIAATTASTDVLRTRMSVTDLAKVSTPHESPL